MNNRLTKKQAFIVGIFLFVALAGWGFLRLTLPNNGIFFSQLNKNESIEEFIQRNPSYKFCEKDSHYELFHSSAYARFEIPLFVYYYGTICDKLTLYLVNLPYYVLLACIGGFLSWKLPLDREKTPPNKYVIKGKKR